MPDDGEPPQFGPTRGYTVWYNGTGATKLADVISLATQGVPAGWTASHEHWFKWASFGNLATQKSVTVRLDIVSGGNPPSQPLQTMMAGENMPPQKLAKGVLATKDWQTGTPAAQGTPYHYAGGAPDGSTVHLVFDVDANGNIAQLIWLSNVNTGTDYFAGCAQNTTLVLSYQGIAVPPLTYHYLV